MGKIILQFGKAHFGNLTSFSLKNLVDVDGLKRGGFSVSEDPT